MSFPMRAVKERLRVVRSEIETCQSALNGLRRYHKSAAVQLYRGVILAKSLRILPPIVAQSVPSERLLNPENIAQGGPFGGREVFADISS